MAAARAVFAEHGFEGATVKIVAETAKVSPGSVMAHFATKDGLFNELLIEDYAHAAEAMRIAVAQSRGAAAARLAHAFAAAYALQLRQRDLLRIGFIVSWRRNQEMDRRNREGLRPVIAIITEILMDGARAREFEGGAEIPVAVELIFDAYLSGYRRAVFSDWDHARLSAHFAKRAALILNGLKHSPTAQQNP